MLMRKLINGEDISCKGIFRSRSCGNFNRNNTYQPTISQFQIKDTIYSNCNFLKANKINNNNSIELRNVIKIAKSRQKKYIDSFWANSMKTKLQTKYDDLYLTSSKRIDGLSVDLTHHSRNVDFFPTRYDKELFSIQPKQNKINLEISALYDIPKSSQELAACCRRILLLKNITAIEKNRIQKEKKLFLKQDYITKKREQELINHENNNIEIFCNFDNYLEFLVKPMENERQLLYELSYQHNILKYDVIKLVNLIEKEKEKLDQCIEERNFLFKMKEKTKELSNEYLSLINQESHNSYLNSVMKSLKNKVTIEALLPVLDNKDKNKKKERIHEENTLAQMEKDFAKLTIQQKEELREKQFRLKNFLNRQYIPYEYPEDFMTEINNLERINITLLASNEKTKTQTDSYKAELDQLKKETENYEKFMQELLDQKEKIRNDAIKRYENLVNVQNNILTSSLFNSSSSLLNNSRNKTRFASAFGGGESLDQMRYKNIRLQFPIEFSCIHNRLIKAIEAIIADTNFGNKIATTYKQEETNAILHTKFTQKNQELIHSTCLKLLRLYEKSVDIILTKNKKFISEPSIKLLITKLINERQEKLKVKNAQDQKVRLEIKREEEKKKIVAKNDKIYFLPNRRRLECYMPNKVKVKEEKKISNLEPTFEELIQYTEELE